MHFRKNGIIVRVRVIVIKRCLREYEKEKRDKCTTTKSGSDMIVSVIFNFIANGNYRMSGEITSPLFVLQWIQYQIDNVTWLFILFKGKVLIVFKMFLSRVRWTKFWRIAEKLSFRQRFNQPTVIKLRSTFVEWCLWSFEMESATRVKIQNEAVSISIHANILGNMIHISVL